MFEIQTADALREMVARQAPLLRGALRVAAFDCLGERIRFAIHDPDDLIQAVHAAGRFYEMEELELIRGVFPRGGTFVDIGANVGNHAVYVGRFLHPGRIIVVEPNPPAFNLLVANLALNDLLGVVSLDWIGVGFSNCAGGAEVRVPPRNLGGARLSEGGPIPLIPGDAALAGVPVDVVKIDVEGMELRVLAGLEATIRRCRPAILVEVERANLRGVMGWAEAMGYVVARSVWREGEDGNHLLVPGVG